MAPDAAKAYLGDTEVGGNIFQRNSHQYIGCFTDQGFIPLFCSVKLYAFNPVDRIYIPCFKYLTKQSFDLGEAVIQFEKLVGIDRNDLRIFQDLYPRFSSASLDFSAARSRTIRVCRA